MNPQPTGLSRIAIRGTTWYFVSFFSGKLLSFASTVILARLLSKDDFGLVAYALTFISFLEVLTSFGIDMSLVYHKESQSNSTASFWMTLGIGIFLFLITYFVAPFVGSFFNDVRVIPIVRALGLTFPFQALGGTHSFLLQKKLKFSLKFVPDIVRAITKALISISLAYGGFGEWSLVWGQVGGTLLATLVLWLIFPWRPSFQFEFSAAQSLLSYGLRAMSVDIVSIIASNIDYVYVGRYLGSEILGVYTLAFRLPELLIGGIARVIGNVIFPIFSHIKENTGDLSSGFYSTTRYVSLITIPLGVGLALVARPFTVIVFTEKWIDIIPIMAALSIFAMMNTLVYNIGTLFKAIGHPQIITWLETVRLLLLIPVFAWAVILVKSVILVAWLHVIVSFIVGVITIYIAVMRSDIKWSGVMKAITPAIFSVTPMPIAVLLILRLTINVNPWFQLTASVLVGCITYLVVLRIFYKDILSETYDIALKAIKYEK